MPEVLLVQKKLQQNIEGTEQKLFVLSVISHSGCYCQSKIWPECSSGIHGTLRHCIRSFVSNETIIDTRVEVFKNLVRWSIKVYRLHSWQYMYTGRQSGRQENLNKVRPGARQRRFSLYRSTRWCFHRSQSHVDYYSGLFRALDLEGMTVRRERFLAHFMIITEYEQRYALQTCLAMSGATDCTLIMIWTNPGHGFKGSRNSHCRRRFHSRAANTYECRELWFVDCGSEPNYMLHWQWHPSWTKMHRERRKTRHGWLSSGDVRG